MLRHPAIQAVVSSCSPERPQRRLRQPQRPRVVPHQGGGAGRQYAVLGNSICQTREAAGRQESTMRGR
jgi:hypothetical protein